MKTKFLVMDVDGTLTDGKIYISNDCELIKVFDVKDGCGIKDILPRYGIVPIVITARESKILLKRCAELGIVEVYQNSQNKVEKLNYVLELYSRKDAVAYSYADCAYIGDDISDLQCMQPIKKAGGLVGCPNDAVTSVQKISDYIAKRKGGEGAVREFIEWLITK